jgi:membrane-bound lytic murein transglycosylase D
MNRAKSMFGGRVGQAAITGGLFIAAAGATITSPRPGPDQASLILTAAAAEVAAPAEAGWDLANLDNERVDMWIERFTTSPTLKPRFATWLDRKPSFEPMISQKLAERAMPQDLIYLAMIESGFNPKAYSHAHAGGLWQFIAETGRRYGLTITRTVDERNHPDKATDAALSYLTDLYDRFGSWYLAAAAYNTGENRVGRLMRTVTGSEKGTDEDYYRISHLLPRETRDYVPMMIAAARIAKEPDKYGFDKSAN